MTTTFSNGAAISTPLTIASIATLAAASYSAPSTLVDNTTTDPTSLSYRYGRLRLAFSAAITAGAGIQYISFMILPALDGTNLTNPPGTAATAPLPYVKTMRVPLITSAAFLIVDTDTFELDPFWYGFQVYNNSGTAFSGTVTPTLYRWNDIGA